MAVAPTGSRKMSLYFEPRVASYVLKSPDLKSGHRSLPSYHQPPKDKPPPPALLIESPTPGRSQYKF